LLERAAGLNREAEVSFRKAAELADKDILLRYLVEMALTGN
jgi:hypothetical protein